MASKALDLVTMGHALNHLSEVYLGDCQWQGVNDGQKTFLAWYAAHREELAKLSGLEAMASTDYGVLNEFLKARGFEPMFRPFEGFGVASILDMLVEWLHKGTITTVSTFDPKTFEITDYPAFKLPATGVQIYDVAGYDQPLARLLTTTGHSLWLMQHAEPESGIALATLAQAALTANRTANTRWTAGAKVPMLELNLKPDLDWMLGMYTDSPNFGPHVLEQAFQQFKLRANEKGARVKVATGFATRGISFEPVPYEFNQPFAGFFTQPGNDRLAMAAFWADTTDAWRNPEGTLEDL